MNDLVNLLNQSLRTFFGEPIWHEVTLLFHLLLFCLFFAGFAQCFACSFREVRFWVIFLERETVSSWFFALFWIPSFFFLWFYVMETCGNFTIELELIPFLMRRFVVLTLSFLLFWKIVFLTFTWTCLEHKFSPFLLFFFFFLHNTLHRWFFSFLFGQFLKLLFFYFHNFGFLPNRVHFLSSIFMTLFCLRLFDKFIDLFSGEMILANTKQLNLLKLSQFESKCCGWTNLNLFLLYFTQSAGSDWNSLVIFNNNVKEEHKSLTLPVLIFFNYHFLQFYFALFF